MYLSIWFGIVMSTSQSGCSVFHKGNTADVSKMQVRRAEPMDEGNGKKRGLRGTVASILNPDSPVPSVPPPGVRTRYSSIHTDEPVIAMTFDDGPHPQNTPKLLDLLKERNIKATFFVVGQMAASYPAIIRRIVEEGHELGNHTYTHATLTARSDAVIRSELQRSADLIKQTTGYTMHLMRPPGGATNKRIEQWVFNEFGYTDILWSVDPQDWRRPGVSVVQNRLINGAHNGAIMLAHDLHAPTITAMPRVFDELLAKGYRFVTVSQLLNIEKNSMPVGVVVKPDAQSETTVKRALPVTTKDKRSS